MAKPRVIEEIDESFAVNENFAELFEKEKEANLEEGSVVSGKIVAIEKDAVLVDIGFKSEGRILLKDFPKDERDNLKVGNDVEVYLERIENRRLESILSREKAVKEESWRSLEKFYKKEEQVEGVIFGAVKGGFTVDLKGTVAFLPGSQVDVRPVKDIGPLMGISQPFIILKMDKKRGNIVVSRRAILEESRSAERSEALADIKEGSVLEGVVKNVTDYGAFIDLGAVDGLLHVTDVSWKRISHPSEVLKLGDTIKVKVIKFDQDTQRISLGLKQLEDNPWENADGLYAEGTKHKGHITNITDYGVFVELQPGIEGLVHVSEMSWTKKNIHPSKIVSTSQEVEVVVLSIDAEKRRLALGMKQCSTNPWEEFAKKHKKGDELEGEIKSVADFGLFVSVGENTDGLVHLSDITWNSNPEEEIKNFKKGDKIKVLVLDFEPEKERISLGIKQLTDNPLAGKSGLKKGAVSTFIVTDVNDNGVEVQVSDDMTSFIKKSDLSRDRVECRPDRFSVGDKVDAKIVDVDEANRKVKLSIKAMEIDDQKKAIAEFGSTDSGASLGGILGVALEEANSKKKASKKAEEDKKEDSKAKKEDKAEAKKPAAKKAEAKDDSKKTTAKKAEAKKEPAKKKKAE